MKDKLLQKLQNLPNSAGVYQYFDKSGKLLYVGKAKNLKNRVKSYFRFFPFGAANNLSLRIKKMIDEAWDIEWIIVESEHDALLLENSLIKQLNPKYNILLRDDKTYPYIYIDYEQKYPRFDITRKVLKSKKIHYFGPYSVGARDILDSIYELTKLVQKKSCLKGGKACLFYQIKRCLAPCEFEISKQEYENEVQKALSYIKDKKLLIKELTQKMHILAENMRFEEAMELRDRIERIERSSMQSSIDFASSENYDIFVVSEDAKKAVVVKLFMREGKIVSSDSHVVNKKESFELEEFLERSIVNFYAYQKPPIVAPLLISHEIENKELLESYLSKELGKKVTVTTPKRGAKKQLIDLALLNAKELLRQKEQKSTILEEIQELFFLSQLPEKIEVFDNSHLMGKACVGAMVVWQDDGFAKEHYRHYHLEAKNEYDQMRELLTRRAKSFEKEGAPDLWVIDGGATLLKLAYEIVASSGANVDVIAIAKEKLDAKAHRAKGSARDIIYTKEDAFELKPSDKRLQFIQRLRDEAHRFAITFHKKTKIKADTESELLKLHGISEAKIKKLLNYFGTFEAIKEATFDEISTILNTKDAKIVKKFYR